MDLLRCRVGMRNWDPGRGKQGPKIAERAGPDTQLLLANSW